MRIKVIRNVDAELITIVNGNSLPDAITKVKKNPKKYKWGIKVIGDYCWSAENLPPIKKRKNDLI